MRLPWLKLWCDARSDSKLDALTDREFRLWFKLLCLAAEREPRGTVDLVDIEFVAMELRVGSDELDSAISRMVRLRLVERSDEHLLFPAFAARQATKPSDRPEATRIRKRKTRGNVHVTPLSRLVTPCHADVTPLSRTEEEVDGEKKQRVQGEPVPVADLLAAARQQLDRSGR